MTITHNMAQDMTIEQVASLFKLYRRDTYRIEHGEIRCSDGKAEPISFGQFLDHAYMQFGGFLVIGIAGTCYGIERDGHTHT